MRALFLKPQAGLDLLEIWNHLAEENLDAALRFNTQVDADLEALKQTPGLGHFRRDLTKKDVRFWTVYSWFIIYQFDDAEVTILRVIHGMRNVKKILKTVK
jgi:plasmid stabilization system protein ParE